jgi:LysR family glycine cleavage system transcriptional activator
MKRWLPSLNGLRAFEAVARHQSFTRAAAELNVTQTAVSHQIRTLEERLGLKLFERRGRALRLTEAATGYLPSVRSAFDELHAATARLLRHDGGRTLTVSTLTTFAAKWLVPRLGGFQDLHPEISIRISTSMAPVDFERDDVDVAIRYGRGDWPGLRVDQLIREDIFPVCSPKLLEGPRPLRQPDDLGSHTLLHVPGFLEDWQVWLTAANVDGIDPSRGLRFDLIVNALQAAIDGLGVALGRTALVKGDLAAGRLVAPFDISLPIEAAYYVVAPEQTADQPKIKAFREWLITTLATA